jgi:uncharacterized membrane protein YhaH (DUF805 family)
MALFWDYSGRVGRMTWWGFHGGILAVLFLIWTFTTKSFVPELLSSPFSSFFVLIFLSVYLGMVIYPPITVRRLHDIGKDGTWSLIVAIPFAGALWLAWQCGLKPGDPDENEYGPPPDAAHRQLALIDEIDALERASRGPELSPPHVLPQVPSVVAVPRHEQTPSGPVFGRR